MVNIDDISFSSLIEFIEFIEQTQTQTQTLTACKLEAEHYRVLNEI
jgi:hypothetical protein